MHNGTSFKMPPLSEARSRLAAVASGCKIAFAGGRAHTASGESDVVDIFDVCNHPPQHAPGTTLSQARSDLAAVALGGTPGVAVFIGGAHQNKVSDFADVVQL